MVTVKDETSADCKYAESLEKDFYDEYPTSKTTARNLQSILQSTSWSKNTVPRSKRRHTSDDVEDLPKTPPPKRMAMEGAVKDGRMKAERAESAGYKPAPAKVPHKSTKKGNQEQTFIVKVKTAPPMSRSRSESPSHCDWLPDDSSEGRMFIDDLSTEPLQNPRDWIMGSPGAIRQQYREIEVLTDRLLAVKQDVEDFLKKYDVFGPLEHSDDDGSSQTHTDQSPDPFAEGGLNNPLEIEDDDEVVEGDSEWESLTQSHVSSAEESIC